MADDDVMIGYPVLSPAKKKLSSGNKPENSLFSDLWCVYRIDWFLWELDSEALEPPGDYGSHRHAFLW